MTVYLEGSLKFFIEGFFKTGSCVEVFSDLAK